MIVIIAKSGNVTGCTFGDPEWTEPMYSLRHFWKYYYGTISDPIDIVYGDGFDTGMSWKQDPKKLFVDIESIGNMTADDLLWLKSDDCPIDIVNIDMTRATAGDWGKSKQFVKSISV